ncbi:MAG: hypothetical protein OEZ24_04550 [Candidatus Bathyarchaeota archaeon]|nr:hypothetical protein [Candidatus Bathyarchaeota archaeon]
MQQPAKTEHLDNHANETAEILGRDVLVNMGVDMDLRRSGRRVSWLDFDRKKPEHKEHTAQLNPLPLLSACSFNRT